MTRHRRAEQAAARATKVARAALLLLDEHHGGHISEDNYQILTDALRAEINALEQ
ncbi:MAG: hypothetical protein J2P16_15870 [Mycobacterium sp.]|nr:hypothetical protein [Mycobacterium sp.]